MFSQEEIENFMELREETYSHYEERLAQYEWNDMDNVAPIISVCCVDIIRTPSDLEVAHGTDFSKACFISMTGYVL